MDPQIVGKRVKKLIENSNIDKITLAKEIGITIEELEKKLDGKEEFYVSEVIIMTKVLGLSVKTVAEVFFATEVDEDNTAKKSIKDSNSKKLNV